MGSGNKSIFLFLVPVIAALLPVSAAFAVTTNIGATATILLAITLSSTAMDFSLVDYTSNPSGQGWWVKMGTNGATTFNGGFSASAGATPAAGRVTILTGTVGHTVEVRCDSGVTMANAGGKTIGVVNIEVKDAASPGAFGTGSACNGIAGAAATTLVLDGTDGFRFGGKIDGDTVSAAGVGFGDVYSTSAAGDSLQVDIIYQ